MTRQEGISMKYALIILCGGSSRRMGTDKALLPFGEECLLTYLVKKYQPYFPKIYLSIKTRGDYTSLSLPVTEIPDLYPDAGPMSGVFSGLAMMDEERAFFLPIDIPFLEPQTALTLLEGLSDSDICTVAEENYEEIPAAAYSKGCIPSIGKCLLLHQFTFQTLREKCSVSYRTKEELSENTKTPPNVQFAHLDTRTDYYQALRHLHCICPPKH